MITVTREMPAGKDFVVCSIPSGEAQFLDQRPLSSKLRPGKREKPAKPVRPFAANRRTPAQRRSPAGGLAMGFPYLFLFSPVAR